MRKLQTPVMFSLLLAMGIGLSGCQQQRAEISLKKTQQTLAEITEKYQGNTHEAEKIVGLQNTITQANNQLTSEPGQALELAKKASAEATQLLESVKPKEANARFNRAREEIRVADVNELRRIDKERNDRIRDLMGQADAAKNESKWDDMIARSQSVIDEVEQGLSTLRNDAERKGLEAEQIFTELQQVGGNIYAPEVVIAVQDDINNAKKIAQEQRDYQLGINRYSDAIARAQEGIDQVFREKSRLELEKIEGALTTSLIEGALDFKADDYNRTFALYEEMLKEYNAGRYTRVLQGVESLSQRAIELVIQTKRAASDDRISTMANDIADLENDGILEYLPDSLKNLRDNVAEARQVRVRDDEAAFDQIKAISVRSREELERVKETYGNLAADRIRGAKGRLEQARGVFEEMKGFFESMNPEGNSDDRAFEAQKRSRQTELAKRLDEAALNLNLADLRRQQGQNRGAITLSEEVGADADRSLGDIYHLVGQNAVIELSKLISRYERDGARQYAVDELARSNQKLDVVKGSIAAQRYAESVREAAEARAEVELMAQRIAGRATVDIRDASEALKAATSEKTRRFRGEMLEQVAALIETAKQDLQQERLKLALEGAQNATQLANQAKKEAELLTAKERMDGADASLNQAQEAGAELYAGREVEEARRLLSSARALFAAEDFVKADELAELSAKRSQDALFKKINAAEASIATAKSVGGWEYDSRTLADANTRVREARKMIEERRYAQSAAQADQARSIADSLSGNAKDFTFTKRVAAIEKNLEEGTKQGINFFQPEDSIAIRREIASLQNRYTRDDYERVMTDVEKLEARLRGVLTETDVLVNTVAQQQEDRLNNLESEGAVLIAGPQAAEARESLRYARLDYKRGLYKSAHSNLTRAIDRINEVETRLYQDTYYSEVQELFEQFRAAQEDYSAVLALDPNELKELSVGPNGAAQSVAISAQVTPMQFRAKMDELYTRALVMKPPASTAKLHESVVEALAEARASALNFEKLAILNRLATSEAKAMIDSAYLRMNNANRMVTDVQRHIISEQVRHRSTEGAAATMVQSR